MRLRTAYIEGKGSIRVLATEFGIGRNAVEHRSKTERWPALRQQREEALLNRLVTGLDRVAATSAGPAPLSTCATEDLSAKLGEELGHLPDLAARLRANVEAATDAKASLEAMRAYSLAVELWRGALPARQPADSYPIAAEIIDVVPNWQPPAIEEAVPISQGSVAPPAAANPVPVSQPAPVQPEPPRRVVVASARVTPRTQPATA